MADENKDQFREQTRQLEQQNKERREQQAAAAAEGTREEMSEEERLRQIEEENRKREEEQAAAVGMMGEEKEKKSKTEKKVEKRIGWGVAGGACSCCLPLIFALILSLGILATIIIVAKNMIDASSNVTDTLQPLT
jgi:hypothetical protein